MATLSYELKIIASGFAFIAPHCTGLHPLQVITRAGERTLLLDKSGREILEHTQWCAEFGEEIEFLKRKKEALMRN